jgi:hypothetical protein
MSVKDYTGIVIGLGAVLVGGFIAYKWLNPSTRTPTANNPFSGAGQIPIVPSDYHYVNPILCALGAKDFCPVPAPAQGACVTDVWSIKSCPGGFNYNRGEDGCIFNVVCV